MTKKTELMRVPTKFKIKVFDIVHKRNFKSATDFLDNEGTQILDNADFLSDLIFPFRKRRKK